jgi:chromosome segregation ATPase
MGLTAPRAKAPSLQQSANLANQLQLIKDLLSALIITLVDDSSKIKEILEQIESQLPESLRVKLWPAGHLPFFRAEVKAAQQRIEARRSQVSLKTDIAQKCKALNQKKATLDAKGDISENTRRLNLLEKELMELEEKVRTTQRLIQEEKPSIANSKQEAQEMTEQIQAEFAEISTLSRQIISGNDKDDKAIIVRADVVRAEAIHAIEGFLN